MKPHGGFLIAAVLVLAIATGCRREEDTRAATDGGPYRRSVSPPPVSDVTAVDAPPAPRPAGPPPAARPGLGEARDELDKLAQDARQLRHALLHAEFRGVTDKAKETDNDPR